MREPNLCFPAQNRAAVSINSSLYDRRALDCTATLPLVNSLTHLAYLTSTSPRIREILCLDGGLERLVRILLQTSNKTNRLTLWKYTLAFQTIVNVGVRGTEQIRTKVVNAGVIPLVLTILGNFAKSYELVHGKKEHKKDASHNNNNTTNTTKGILGTINHHSSPLHSQHNAESSIPPTTHSFTKPLRRSTFPYIKIDPSQRRYKRIHKEKQESKSFADMENIFHREEDVLLCLQLLAYLSKYPHIRDLFHTAYQKNVFSVVEKFCHRIHPGAIQYWAGVIMRNACRKDEDRGGIRRCANMSCGKWEAQPREFAKCRRCRKAKYCSKACQSKAWQDGHRWWCVERPSSMVKDATALHSLPTMGTATVAHDHHVATATTNAASSNNSNTTNSGSVNNNSNNSSSSSSSNHASTATHHHHHHHHSNNEQVDNRNPSSDTTTAMLMEMGVHMEL
ncbi:hypothetical protein BD560DRAFT_390711 [Blakeslea trispora]|nr:hypothetical protein BD560DRAFT_390711 [Blakeslea trispora]